jgi:hypothetical protein
LEAALRNVIRDGIEDVRRRVPNGMAGEIVAIVAAVAEAAKPAPVAIVG